jgi:hypothetical protein
VLTARRAVLEKGARALLEKETLGEADLVELVGDLRTAPIAHEEPVHAIAPSG